MSKTWKTILNSLSLDTVTFDAKFLKATIKFNENDKEAAWELYIELITRIATQKIPHDSGDEKAALDSIYSLFTVTRDILKQKGRKCIEFSKLAVIILNHRVRPFTAKWHKQCLDDAFKNTNACLKFRTELEELQDQLIIYAGLLAELAEVENLLEL